MTMMSWNDAGGKAQSSGGGGGGDWIRLGSGESMVGVICGQPWAGEKWSPWGVKDRFALNVFDVQTKIMRIFECAPLYFTDLVRCKNKYDAKHGAGNWSMEIGREGEGKATRYSFSFEDSLNEAQRGFVEREEVKDLDNLYANAAEPRDDQGGGDAGNAAGGGGSVNGTPIASDQDIPF